MKSIDEYAKQVDIAVRNNDLIYGDEYTHRYHFSNSINLNNLYKYEYQKKLYR